jgi:BlaI family penicillinase repressor
MASEQEPSDVELQVLSVLWAEGPLTARQVLGRMPDRKPRAYTSVLSTLQVMERKGLVSHRAGKQSHVYRARAARGPVLGRLLGRLVSHVFGGDPAAAVQSLLQQTPIAPDELAEIRRIVDAHGADATAGEDHQ